MEAYLDLGQILLKTCVLDFNEVVNTKRAIVQRRGILAPGMHESLCSTQSHISRGVPANRICGTESRGKGQGQGGDEIRYTETQEKSVKRSAEFFV